MAFPTVAGTTEGGLTATGTSVPVTLPAGGVSTDEYIVIMNIGTTSATVNALTGWTEILDEAVASGLKIIRYSGAGVPSNPTFITSAATRTVWGCYRITGASKTITPQIGTTATGTSTTPDPPSVTPTGGTSKDYLSIVFFGLGATELADNDTLVTTFPTGYTSNQIEKTGGTGGTSIGGLLGASTGTNTTGAAINPGTFTNSISAAWRAQHILVHPAPTPTVTSVARISLESQPTPTLYTAHTIEARARKTSGTGVVVLKAALYEGANNRSGDLTSGDLTTSLADYSLAISDANAATITDYSDLEIRLWATSLTADAVGVEVAELKLVTPQGIETGQTFDLTPATEADESLAVADQKFATIAATDEADAAQALVARRILSLTPAAETDTTVALGLTTVLIRSLTPATEADTAAALSLITSRTLTPAAETDAAQAVAKQRVAAIAPASETDQAQALVAGRGATLAAAVEADAAQAVAFAKRVTLAHGAEVDTAITLQVAGPQIINLTAAVEADSAQAVTARRSVTPVAATETDTAVQVVASRPQAITAAQETDTATAVALVRSPAVTPAVETDQAQSVTFTHYATLGLVLESDVATALNYGMVGDMQDFPPDLDLSMNGWTGDYTRLITKDDGLVTTAALR